MSNKVVHNKKALLEALEKSLGIVTTACKAASIGRTTYYEYYRDDPFFKEQVDELANVALDVAESKLHENIKANKEASIMFYLKTKGKARGYIERSDGFHISGDTPFDMKIIFRDGKGTETS